MEGFWNKIKKGFQTGVSATVEKTEELSRIGKLKLDIAATRRDMNRTFTQLGEIIYQIAGEEEKPELWDNEQVKSSIEKINAQKLDIKAKEEELERIREEKGKQKTKEEAEEETSS